MKNLILLIVLFIFGNLALLAQPPEPPASANNGGGPVGDASGAPIGDGTYILLTLAAAYALRTTYKLYIIAGEE